MWAWALVWSWVCGCECVCVFVFVYVYFAIHDSNLKFLSVWWKHKMQILKFET